MTKTPKSYPSRTIAVLLLLLLAGISSRLISLPSTHGREEVPGSRAPSSLRTNQQSCCDQNGDKTHLLAASYYRVANNMVATLMLNNKGPEPIEVKPTLFSLTGERLEAAPVIVEGESFRNIDLGTFGALPGSPFEEGSLQLFHRGPDLVIGAQLYLVDEEHSLSFDESWQSIRAPSRRSSRVCGGCPPADRWSVSSSQTPATLN